MRRGSRALALAVIAAVLAGGGALATNALGSSNASAASAPSTGAGAGSFALRRAGADFVDGTGRVVQLHGVNRPGLEYRCTQRAGFISDDGHAGGAHLAYADRVASSFRSWPGINVVRVPLNEDCWLGINGVPPAYSGRPYRSFVKRLVQDLTARRVYVVLDLHWAAPGRYPATTQGVAPDADHSLRFWAQVASVYKAFPNVAFDLFNEPRLNCGSGSGCPYASSNSYSQRNAWIWALYRDGGTYRVTPTDQEPALNGVTMRVVGTQRLVDVIREKGARNVVIIEGLGYGNSLDYWARAVPRDPANQLAASAHQYPNSGANAYNTQYVDWVLSMGIAGHYPLLLGEFGEWACGSKPWTFTTDEMNWADRHGYSWTAWGWDAGEGCGGPSLVTSDNYGTPSAYGAIVKRRLARQG